MFQIRKGSLQTSGPNPVLYVLMTYGCEFSKLMRIYKRKSCNVRAHNHKFQYGICKNIKMHEKTVHLFLFSLMYRGIFGILLIKVVLESLVKKGKYLHEFKVVDPRKLDLRQKQIILLSRIAILLLKGYSGREKINFHEKKFKIQKNNFILIN